jgi:hypothetical protein
MAARLGERDFIVVDQQCGRIARLVLGTFSDMPFLTMNVGLRG